jgi:glycine/serine hydroxymethyltransferase
MGVEEMRTIAELIHRVLAHRDDDSVLAEVRGEVAELCSASCRTPLTRHH